MDFRHVRHGRHGGRDTRSVVKGQRRGVLMRGCSVRVEDYKDNAQTLVLAGTK